MLGNHDRGKDSSGETLLKQIRVLGEKYCAWDLKIFNNQLNILSARPCSSGGGYYPVSYTHLTLPTNREV